jgi:WD40 repeat protein
MTDYALADTGSRDVVIAVDRAASTVVRKLRISPDGKLLALGDDEGLVRIIRLQNFEVVATIPAHSKRISDLDFSPDSRTLLSAGRDGLLRFWDLATSPPSRVRELKAPGSIPYSAKMNLSLPDRFILMGDREGRVIAWDLKRNHIITNTQFHHGPVHSVAYRPNGNGTFLSGAGDGELKIRLPEGKRLSFHTHDGVMFQASYSATGRLVYTVGSDRIAKIWDATSERLLNSMSGHLKYVLAADMSRDEKLLVTGGGDKALNLWDVASGRLVGRMQGHTSDIESVAFSPDGKYVVSASEDKSVVIWSVENQEDLARLYFQKAGEKYAGVTFENQAFGERNSGLLSVYVDGKQLPSSEAERVVRYIGRGISILEP